MRKNKSSGLSLWVMLVGLILLSQSMLLGEEGLTAEQLDVFKWRNIGPFTFSGRITDFAVPKGQSQIYYVATATGGIWKTEDGGISFKPIFDDYGNMSIGNIAVAPSDSNIVYVGTGEALHARSSAHGNGMWRSDDAGKTWKHIGLEESYFIPKIAVDHENPDIVYVAAEGKLYDNKMDCQRGLYKTVDGGKTWEQVLDLKDRGVGDFVIDPTNSDVIIAGAYKTYRRTWTFIDRQPGNHFYKSADGGKTWKKLTNGLPMELETGWNGITIYPKNPNIVYIRMDEEVDLGLDQRENRQLYRAGDVFKDDYYFNKFKSFEIDPALKKLVDFEPISAKDERELAEKLNELIKDEDFLKKTGVDLEEFIEQAKKVYKKQDDILDEIDEVEELLKETDQEPEKEEAEEKEEKEPKGRHQVLNRFVIQTLYAPALKAMEPVTKSGVIYRSEDQGETWERMTEYKISGGSIEVNAIEAGYSGRIKVDPNNDQILYAVEVVSKVSEDGGKTFKNTPWTGAHKCHVDMRGIWIDPLNSDHILSANDGGVSETWDGGKHWSQKETISAQQFYDISVDHEMPYNVMGGTQDNGSWIGPSQNRNQNGVYPADWRYLPSGDGFYVVRDWWNPEYIYFESQFGNSRRMNLDTGEMTGLSKRNTQEEREAGKEPERYQWDAPIVLSPHNPGIVYVCSQHVHKSTSRGEPGTFVTISPDLSKHSKERIEQSKLTNLQYATIYTFAESSIKPGVYWAGTDDGNLQLSTNKGSSWINITERFYNEKGNPKADIKGARIPYDRWVTKVEPSAHELERCYVTYSGYRTHNEDDSYIFVTEDFGKTWKDISAGMKNPVRDIEEDPDNPDVLYLATDYGLFVSIDRGETWENMSTSAPDVIIMSLDIQKRDRDLAIATYGRGIYIVDIYPFKEFSKDVFLKDHYLFEVQSAVKWNRFERRGQSYGEFARVSNPDVGATFYCYLKEKTKSVTLSIKNMKGEEIYTTKGGSDKGLHKIFWDLRKPPEEDGSSRWRRRGEIIDAGMYEVSLVIGDEEVMSQTFQVCDDPMFD
ncbi:MAG TPA: hypothetical protein VFG01_08385 [Acidobacteriota bacterium]|nr:hypothetical protein [Acidobacteriota bacterium]